MAYDAQLAFIVLSAKLTSNAKIILVSCFKKDNMDDLLYKRIPAELLERYLKCLHVVECPTLVQWIEQSDSNDVRTRVAQYLECMDKEKAIQETVPDYRNYPMGVL